MAAKLREGELLTGTWNPLKCAVSVCSILLLLIVSRAMWGVMAERFSASDLCSDGRVIRMWVRILAANMVLVSVSKTLDCNCFSSPRSINGHLWGWGRNCVWWALSHQKVTHNGLYTPQGAEKDYMNDIDPVTRGILKSATGYYVYEIDLLLLWNLAQYSLPDALLAPQILKTSIVISQDFFPDFRIIYKSHFTSVLSWRKRSGHWGKKEVTFIVSKPLVSCLWGCGESV